METKVYNKMLEIAKAKFDELENYINKLNETEKHYLRLINFSLVDNCFVFSFSIGQRKFVIRDSYSFSKRQFTFHTNEIAPNLNDINIETLQPNSYISIPINDYDIEIDLSGTAKFKTPHEREPHFIDELEDRDKKLLKVEELKPFSDDYFKCLEQKIEWL